MHREIQSVETFLGLCYLCWHCHTHCLVGWMNKQILFLLSFISGFFGFVRAENADSLSGKRISILPVPTFGYSPETRTYAGAVCLFNYRLGNATDTRASNSKIEFTYTQRKQIISEIGWNVFSNKEKIFSSGRISYSKFPDYFWGKGINTSDSNRITYSTGRFLAETVFAFKIKKNTYIGSTFRMLEYSQPKLIEGKQEIFNQIETGKSISVPGIAFIKDTRNNLLLPEQGMYFTFQYSYILNPSKPYQRILLDARKYGKWKNNILALRFKNLYSDGPMYDLALLGGDDNARGYYAGRYRDKMSSSLQAEAKRTIYKRWGIAVFGGASTVMGSDRVLSLKPNFGGGIRFLIDRKENINFRLDYAVGTNGNSGFYIAFGESF